MNTLDMPMNYVPPLEEQDAVAKDVSEESLAVNLMELIDDYAGEEWSNDDGEDLLAALGGESFEQALEDGVTLLDGVCGISEEDILNFVADSAPPSTCVKSEPQEPPTQVTGERPQCSTPPRDCEVFEHLVLSPFSMNAASVAYDIAACHPGDEIWEKFEFPTDMCSEKKPVIDLFEYSKKFSEGLPKIDWDAELAHEEPVQVKEPKKECVERLDIMWSAQNHNNSVDMVHRPKPMLTPAQLRRKLMSVDANEPKEVARNISRVVALTPDNALPLANRSTTVPAVKSRPMRSVLNTQKLQQTVKTNSRSLLLPTARTKTQAEVVTPPSARGSKTVKAVVSVRSPPADSSAHIKCGRTNSTDVVVPSGSSPRPETPQSIAESEDEAPVFRHNTIDTIFTSTMCDATASSTMYLTPSDSSGSPKSTFCEDYDDEEEEDDDDDDEDYEPEEEFVSDPSNLRSPPEAVIREERPARTVLPYISDHSYHLSKTSVRTDNLGVQTPSDSEEEIDVVSVGGDKSCARLPNNPSARDRRQLQQKVASAIQRNGGRQQNSDHRQQQVQTEAPAAGKKRQQASGVGRGGGGQAKRARVAAPGGRGRRRVNSDEEPDPCEKRSMHNSMERQRRIDLRNLVEKLRLLVPATENNKRAAKVVILREAAEYCRINTPIMEEREVLIRELREKQEALMVRLSQLRTQVAAARLGLDGEE